jgi:hypothetical protein
MRAPVGAHRLFARVHQSGRLLTDEALDPETIGAGGRAFLSAQARMPDAATLAARSTRPGGGRRAMLTNRSRRPPIRSKEDRDA